MLFRKHLFTFPIISVLLVIVCYGFNSRKGEPKLLLKSNISSISNDSIVNILSSNYFYDFRNRIIEIRHTKKGKPDGYSNFFYDKQLSHSIMYDSDSVKIGVYKYEYKDDNLIKRTSFNADESVIKNVLDYTYNENGKIIKVVNTEHESETTFLVGVTFYEYLEDNIVKKTYKNNDFFYLIKYDNMKTPFSEIPFYKVSLMNSDVINDLNNRVSYLKSSNSESGTLYANTYDEDDFLKKQIISISNNKYIKEYTYNK